MTLSTGCVLRDFDKNPRGSLAFAPAVEIEMIPRSEWRDRIEEKKKNKSRLSDIWKRAGIPLIYQNGLGWCWAFGCTNNIMLSRAVANQPFLHLSPSSIAGPVANYRNTGMPIYAALERACSHGIADVSVYPELTQDRLWTPEVEANASRNVVQEHWDLEVYDGKPKTKGQQEHIFEILATCLLRDMPVTVALDWWGHCVTYCDLDFENNRYVVDGVNSHGANYKHGNAPYAGWFRFPEGTGQHTANPYEMYVSRVVSANSGR